MGSKVTRMLRNYNIENRAHREVSKAKPQAAPRYATEGRGTPANTTASRVVEEIHQKNNPLLSMLKDVYVESKDPLPQAESGAAMKNPESKPLIRLLKFSVPADPFGFSHITEVPKGKLSLVEALTALSNHKNLPEKWTPEKLAQEYSLDPKDAKALTEFFSPFDIKVIPKNEEETKKIQET